MCSYVTTQIIDYVEYGECYFLLFNQIKINKQKENDGKHIWFSQKGGIKTFV